MENWYALAVRTGRERAVAAELGVPVQMPLTHVPRRESRRSARLIWKPEAKLPGYVFAQVKDWPATLKVADVYHPVTIAGDPAVMPARDLEALAQMNEPHPESDPNTVPPAPVYRQGDMIEIIAGAFEGRVALVTRVVKTRLRIRVGQYALEIPAACAAPVTP